ncbi:MAG: hypothetical protein S0880_11580 [Actinomycetota bacterium]|nr:hypothetical protein [Actinomycetota bacterium]
MSPARGRRRVETAEPTITRSPTPAEEPTATVGRTAGAPVGTDETPAVVGRAPTPVDTDDTPAVGRAPTPVAEPEVMAARTPGAPVDTHAADDIDVVEDEDEEIVVGPRDVPVGDEPDPLIGRAPAPVDPDHDTASPGRAPTPVDPGGTMAGRTAGAPIDADDFADPPVGRAPTPVADDHADTDTATGTGPATNPGRAPNPVGTGSDDAAGARVDVDDDAIGDRPDPGAPHAAALPPVREVPTGAPLDGSEPTPELPEDAPFSWAAADTDDTQDTDATDDADDPDLTGAFDEGVADRFEAPDVDGLIDDLDLPDHNWLDDLPGH